MAKPLFHVWPKNHPIFRIHSEAHGATRFNASGLGNARFSPLLYPDGKLVPTLYGGATFHCAAMETIFHDLPDDIDHYLFDFQSLAAAAVSTIAPGRDLKLLALTSVGLKPLKLKKTQVIETAVTDYPRTREYALAWHRTYTDIDGLYWTSRQDDRAQACMLFGDRVKTADLAILTDRESLQAAPHIEHLVRLAKDLGISQARSFPSAVVGF